MFMLILYHPSENKKQKTHAHSISGKYAEYLNWAFPLLELKEYLGEKKKKRPFGALEWVWEVSGLIITARICCHGEILQQS